MSDFQCCRYEDLEADYAKETGEEGPDLMASGGRSVVIDADTAEEAAEKFAMTEGDRWDDSLCVVVEHENGKRQVFDVRLRATATRASGRAITPRVGPKEWP